MTTMRLFRPDQWAVIDYCAEEVRRQRDTPVHVARMLRAWSLAMDVHARRGSITHSLIRQLGALIDEANEDGYRTGPVWVGDKRMAEAVVVPALLDDLIADQTTLVPSDWYRRFEEVHPFNDGNGRTGKVLFNFLLGALRDPEWPPNFWGISNP